MDILQQVERTLADDAVYEVAGASFGGRPF